MDPTVEYRFNKVDDAIQRLASVAADLSKLLAVCDQRILQQEKNHENTSNILEKRREEHEAKLEEVYETIFKHDSKASDELKSEIRELRDQAYVQNAKTDKKIAYIEKLIWMALGGGAVIGFIAQLLFKFMH